MKEQMVTLKSYRRKVEIITLTLEVPTYEPTDERGKWFPRYEDVLLRLFNNKREEEDILEIRNYYSSNKITMVVNLTDYVDGGYGKSKDECIEQLVKWFIGGLDVAPKDVKKDIGKAYIYEINGYDNNIPYKEGDDYIETYIHWEEV